MLVTYVYDLRVVRDRDAESNSKGSMVMKKKAKRFEATNDLESLAAVWRQKTLMVQSSSKPLVACDRHEIVK